MILFRTSATTCGRLYNASLAKTHGSSPPADWPFNFTVSTDHIWDVFVILALLGDCQGHSATLKVPHTGKQKDHFMTAVQACNIHFCLNGQPELCHFCHRCLHVYLNRCKVWVVVIDGVTVHWENGNVYI